MKKRLHNTACSRFFYPEINPFFNYSTKIPIGKNFYLLIVKK